ncbi:MAG: Gfo/Idh/MocA family oxidoreductase [Actinomycetia bacterium]|nr:Gfo/Idh/MocA family oxidoreductase [Actinomycetes bacterium]
MIRTAVVGAGIMGANHVRVLGSLPGSDLVAVVDASEERARAAAGEGTLVFPTVGAMLADLPPGHRPEAVVVSTPTSTHHPVATELIEAGLHVLIEKPIASTVQEGADLQERADRAGVILAVGHIERFNAAAQELLRTLDGPLHIEARRIGPFSSRVPESVVNDLMIHDLDLVSALVDRPVVHVSAVAQSVKTETEDMVTALLRFEGGVTASVIASRLGQQKIRQLEVTTPDAYVVADLLRQDITITKVEHTEYVSTDGTRYRQTAAVEIPFLEHRGEPLAAELRSFLDAINTGDQPAVTAADGIRALELVESVLAAVRSS